MSASEKVVEFPTTFNSVLERLEGAKRQGPHWFARCPAHKDTNPSLKLWVNKGRLQFKCMAQCAEADVAEALGVEAGQRVSGAPKAKAPKDGARPPMSAADVEARHATLMRDKDALRHVTKTLGISLEVVKALKLGLTRAFDGSRLWYPYRSGDGWSHANGRALDGQQPKYRCEPAGQGVHLYRSEVLKPDGVAILLEGERDVASALTIKLGNHLKDLKGVAIVGITGAGNHRAAAEALSGQRLVYLALDSDAAGDKGADEIARLLGPERCRRVRLDGGAKDLGDLLAAQGARKALEQMRSAIDAAKQPEVQARFRTTDVGNAERFAAKQADRVRFVHGGWKRWHLWDGRRWASEEKGDVNELAKETALDVYKDAAEATTLDERGQLSKWARQSERTERLNAMVSLARSIPGLSVMPEDFDVDPYLLNVRNGVLDLERGKLLPHEPTRLMAKLATVEFDPTAKAPRFKAFLEEVIPERAVRDYLQRAVGYSLTASVDEQCLFFCYGSGSNGKSTLLETVRELLGADYAKTAPPDLLMAKQYEQHEERVAELQGARFVLTPEVEEGRNWNETKLKWMTGGDQLTARFMYGSRFAFKPSHKFWVLGNHKPRARGVDHGFWRRIHLVPFEVKVTKVDIHLKEKLKAELPGILNWALEGSMEWRRDRLKPPKSVLEATEKYRSSEDLIEAFLKERCIETPNKRIRRPDLFTAFDVWAQNNNERRLNNREFAARLGERGFKVKASHGEDYVIGLDLRTRGSA